MYKRQATDLTVDNSKSDKGAIIINKDANAYFNGKLDLKLGSNSWYGINVDGAEADFTGVDEFKADGTGTQSAVCLDGSVKGQAARCV